MKICLVAETFDKTWGWGKYVYGLSDYLNKEDIENRICVLYRNKKECLIPSKKIIGISPINLGKLTYFYNTLIRYPLYFNFNNRDYDIYHLTRQYPSLIPPLKFLRKNKVIVNGMDVFSLTLNKKWNYPLYKILIRNIKSVDKIIAISNHVKKDFINLLKIPEEKIKVVYLGVDHKNFKPIKNTGVSSSLYKNKLIEKKKFLLNVGFDVPRKNLKNILFALYYLLKKDKNIFLIRVGQEDLSKESKILIKKLNLEKNIINLQRVSNGELNNLYNLCDIFVFPSLGEGFGMPVLEAMACGKPIITSKNTATEEIVGNCGILINPNNLNDLIKSIDLLLNNPDLKKKLGKMAYQRSKKFSWEKTFKETKKIYSSL